MKKVIFSLLILLCAGCAKEIDSDITSFYYNIGSGLGGYCSYTVEDKNNTVLYTKNCVGIEDADEEREIDRSYLEEIKKIINENKVYKWDGFNKSNNNVMDGSSFDLKVHYSNGQSIDAHGYMKYPSNYKEVKEKLLDYFEKMK